MSSITYFFVGWLDVSRLVARSRCFVARSRSFVGRCWCFVRRCWRVRRSWCVGFGWSHITPFFIINISLMSVRSRFVSHHLLLAIRKKSFVFSYCCVSVDGLFLGMFVAVVIIDGVFIVDDLFLSFKYIEKRKIDQYFMYLK
jgi:hypothetical protein